MKLQLKSNEFNLKLFVFIQTYPFVLALLLGSQLYSETQRGVLLFSPKANLFKRTYQFVLGR